MAANFAPMDGKAMLARMRRAAQIELADADMAWAYAWAKKAAERFYQEDPEAFEAALLTESVRFMYDQVALPSLRKGRAKTSLSRRSVDSIVGNTMKSSVDWSQYMESLGDHHKRLFGMSRSDLYIAAEIRRARAAVEESYADLWIELAGGMGVNDVVEDRYSSADIEAVWLRLHGLNP